MAGRTKKRAFLECFAKEYKLKNGELKSNLYFVIYLSSSNGRDYRNAIRMHVYKFHVYPLRVLFTSC